MGTSGIRWIYDELFGEHSLLAIILTGLLVFCYSYFVYHKKHRNWKLYKKIKGEKAERASEWLEGPEHPKASIFPDLPAEEEPRE